jgi:1,4-alpha-glucan branching enzyme
MEEYRFDGFRFDGVTSMIYRDHGLGVTFGEYGKYFSLNTDEEALTYLQLANRLCREISPRAITIAEDMSAMPGMCLPIEEGGIGFDYRLAMGLPDLWVKLVKTTRDEDWNMWQLWHELTSRRPGEKYIGYVESHDQALVGDKTLLFRLCDSAMYTDMSKQSRSAVIDRGIALCKLIRFATVMLGGEGYLNFMGNEFGHPEWIDFPREGNGWSMFYCRRQWHLADDPSLRYGELLAFDRALLRAARESRWMENAPRCIFVDDNKKILSWERRGVIGVANLHPTASYTDYWVEVPCAGKYRVLLSTDREEFGGWSRVDEGMEYPTHKGEDGRHWLRLYLPARTAVALQRK